VYEWREEDPQFAQAWGDAIEQFHDSLEDVGRERAVDGVLSKVIEDNDGKVVGEIRRYSDRLLELLLKRRRPEIYDPLRRILNVNRKSG
jgi:hypothetical protein